MVPEPISVLFVCLGNICRSTMAEGIFRSMISGPPYQHLIRTVDSCGTGAYHAGSEPDSRTMATLKANSIANYNHEARKVKPSDFSDFDYVFAMDRDNLHNLQLLQSRAGGNAKVMLFGEYAGKEKAEEVDDPYYGGYSGFADAYEQCTRFSKNFLKDVFPDIKP
ncbi:phosphotyrosine protein phosphatase I superfamily [Calycina marina]|uniref:Phosphotyrosine protein phosphatase I superfamily n=1 Tax=Calycina marina TaxID=1763456 RepID=A0A9P7Z5X3_9HELO|nr:phosphotyrosine protein phosphatase I superfamily [Calycina marina]